MITDSHCHLASGRFAKEELPDLIDQAKLAGVSRMVTLATCLEDIEANLEIANLPEVQSAIGIHPCDVHEAPDDAVSQLSSWVGDRRVCAIGETGLDYFHPAPEGWSQEAFRSRQKDFLVQHFELAAKSGLNVVIHTRDREGRASFDDAIDIYRGFSQRTCAVFHCFVSSWSQAEEVFALGGVVSFGGVSTFKKSNELRDVIRRCSVGSFMLETDAPYLAPEPYRGKRNEPAYVSSTALRIAEVRNESVEDLARHTTDLAEEFFRWEI
ncbi:MAG: TatD family hydrolase [Akkermansiaceae bacterium]